MKIIFAGTPQFAASALAALLKEHQVVAVLTQPDRPSGRGMQLVPSPVKQLALQHDLNVMQPATLKNEQVQQELAALDADVMVVAAYGLILPQKVLELPRHGCLNIHASLLPRWRGAAPIQRAILAGDSETGITIMQMDAGLDTGDMLLIQTCPITSEDTAQTLHDKLADIGADSIIEALRLLQQGQLTPQKQDDEAACYAAKLLKSEARVDWNLDAQQIERAIRAFNPFPVCQTGYNGTVIKLWEADLAAGSSAQAQLPGQILAADKHGIVVACGSGALRLKVLQRPGGKPQPAAQFLQALSLRAGDNFSSI